MALMPGNRRIMGVGLNTILRHLKTQTAVGNPRIQPGSDVIVCAEMDEQWATSGLNHVSAGYFTYGRMCRTVVARVFGERTGHAGASSGPVGL